MKQEEILREFLSLPPEDQRQVADFIAYLRQHGRRSDPTEKHESSDLAKDSWLM